MLCCHYPEILNNFILEFVFCKQSLMRLQSTCVNRGNMQATVHIHTCSGLWVPSRRQAEGTARPGYQLRLVTVMVAVAEEFMVQRAQPQKSESLLTGAAAGR